MHPPPPQKNKRKNVELEIFWELPESNLCLSQILKVFKNRGTPPVLDFGIFPFQPGLHLSSLTIEVCGQLCE